MPARIAVITDSSSCLPDLVASRWAIGVVQIQLSLGSHYDDENRFDRGEVIDAMRAGQVIATAPPDPGAFFWAYQEAATAGATAIVSIHISGRMSDTVRAAREAAQQVRIPVHVLDSRTTGMSLGFAAVSAARAAAAGADADRVIEAAERRCTTSTEFIYVDTLEYLRRGGRIGAAQAMLGSAFSIKPLLTVKDGEVAPLARVPGTKRALAKMVDLAVKKSGGFRADIAVTRFGASDHELEIGRQIERRVPAMVESMVVEASTVIGAHLGPGALGITVSPVG
ncbi:MULTISPECIES: DegV family protein [unclassified Amycolatopsis]|jgi:DegV family protein with EDD domain|uniref:DegV family protein n=1 Tax=unclassified Amycolatopsis TaxID=2618356 RepID=UPI00255B6F01|nr:DegV family protein [Amycolatopsis sp. DG1A-15b]WIX88402.1 DegV family protein [Amycolatopsis sp. DG1A-15b]